MRLMFMHLSFTLHAQVWPLRVVPHSLYEALTRLPRRLKSRDLLLDISPNIASDPNFPSELFDILVPTMTITMDIFSPNVPGCDLPRKSWVHLNRVSTACPKKYDTLCRCGPRSSANCHYGHPRQTTVEVSGIQNCCCHQAIYQHCSSSGTQSR